MWTKTAEEILAEVRPARATLASLTNSSAVKPPRLRVIRLGRSTSRYCSWLRPLTPSGPRVAAPLTCWRNAGPPSNVESGEKRDVPKSPRSPLSPLSPPGLHGERTEPVAKSGASREASSPMSGALPGSAP